MMSLKPRNVDFQETWANLKETVAGVVALRAVERGVWNTRFSDVYALCVAHPEPLAAKLYDETRNFLEEHVAGLLERVRGSDPLDSDDHNDGLLERYVSAWHEYSQGVAYLNCLYSYLNLQHVKRQKVSDAEIIYGSAAAVSCPEHDSRQLEVGELGLVTWERVLVRGIRDALSTRIVRALEHARADPAVDPARAAVLRAAIHSTVHVQSFLVRAPLSLYQQLVVEPYLTAAGARHSQTASELLKGGDVSHYMKHILEGLEREMSVSSRFLHPSSLEAVRACYERAAVVAHLPALHAEAARLLREAADDNAPADAVKQVGCYGAAVVAHLPALHAEAARLLREAADDNAPADAVKQRRLDLRRMYTLLKPLKEPTALRPLVDAAHAQVAREGRGLLAAPHQRDEAHTHFVSAMLLLHGKYSALFADVFGGAQPFVGALDKACSLVVNSRPPAPAAPPTPEGAPAAPAPAEPPARAPELLARYCDCLLRKRTDPDIDDKLAAAIVVFKYVDDKDVFQKYYARALARRLIHQLSVSMEQEEAMINRLKAACGYEFTNKLHRMFTDVAVSADLNAKFQQHLREGSLAAGAGFFIQVLQAGAWPLGGAMLAPLAPPAQLERPAALFEEFYRARFSGRRLAWLHHLCTGELRTRYTARVYHISATTPQCALLLCFETADTVPAKEARASLQLPEDAWIRQLRPLLDAGLLTAEGDVDTEDGEGTLTLNLAFSCKRTKVRLTCASAPNTQGVGGAGAGAGGGEEAHCDDDRKMYLQAALVRIMKQRKVLRHTDLIQEVVSQARGSFAPSVAMIKKCIESLIDKQYLERAPGTLDTYSYLA